MKFIITLIIVCLSSYSWSQQKDSPKLVVGIVVDQMCYEYLYRFYDQFGEDGFKKLMTNGANLRSTNYNYVPTYTGPGHASIYTGTTPSNHGIVGNEWYERESGEVINCVGDSTVQTIGAENASGMCSPKNLKANTITDQLKLTYPNAKVISASIKNRGAILPGGHLSDGSYWYDYATGNFVTSTFFKTELPQWVKDFNALNYAQQYMSQTWDLFSPETNTTIDDRPYEGKFPGVSSPTFPYNLAAIIDSANMAPSKLMPYTPFANTFLTDFAINALKSEGLGEDNQTDMLCISYSTPDIIGHMFGPYSREIEDTYLRLDREIARLIKALEQKVGKKGFTLFLTADHAVVPVPQFLMDNNLPGGYFYTSEAMDTLRNQMVEEFGHDFILAQENLNIYLDHKAMKEQDVDAEDVEEFIAQVILDWEGVKRVFTREQLLESGMNDEWSSMVSNGYNKSESGDVIFILEPGYLPKYQRSEEHPVGTSHGSAYGYDTHVPLLWYGSKVTGDVFCDVKITDITATLAHILYVQKPNATTGKPIKVLLRD